MIQLLYQGQYALFFMILVALVISLSFHEFGHAYTAKRFGDDTAERAGRLTVNPVAHIDPMGLLMVVMLGFGYAKPVPSASLIFSLDFDFPTRRISLAMSSSIALLVICATSKASRSTSYRP